MGSKGDRPPKFLLEEDVNLENNISSTVLASPLIGRMESIPSLTFLFQWQKIRRTSSCFVRRSCLP